jgi:hypothetical protein
MKIVRDNETSGRFEAPLKVQYRVSFFPTNGAPAKRLELVRSFTLAPATNATWGAVEKRGAAARHTNVLVDTDGDQIPDTYLAKTSGNFQAGWTPAWERQRQSRVMQKNVSEYEQPIYECSYSPDPECHPEAQGIHCASPCY